MLSETAKLEVLKLAVERANREVPPDFQGTVAIIYTAFYNLINSDPVPAEKPGRKAKAGSTNGPEIFG